MSSTPEIIINSRKIYYTWETFRKDVELNLGHYVPNNLWIQAKPKKPLPWSDSDIKTTISYIKKAEIEILY